MDLPYERVLLATEHTEFDSGAEMIAFALAKLRPATLPVVLPAEINAEVELVAPEADERFERELHDRLLALEAQARRAGIALEVNVRRGREAWREIVDEARERAADLLILRRRGRQSFLKRLMIGAMVERVATEAPCSVLLVPRAAPLWSERVLAGVDATSQGHTVAAAAGRIAHRARLPLTLVCVATDDTPKAHDAATAIAAAAVRTAAASGAQADGRVAVGRPADTIADLAARLRADLLVVGRGGREVHGPLHFGSTARRVVGLADCAVLVVEP